MFSTRVLGALTALCVLACGPSGQGSLTGSDGGGGKEVGADASIYFDAGSSGEGGIQGCDPKNFTLQQKPPPQVYLVVDRSGSMDEPGSAPSQTKWEELNAAVDHVLQQFQGAIELGLMMYPADSECTTAGPQVKFDVGNRAAIMSHLAAAVPAGGTPTAAALNNAASSLRALGRAESPKLLVLATDGGPNCNYGLSADPSCSCARVDPQYCCTNYPLPCDFGHHCLDDGRTAQVIADLHTAGIDTFVIGLAGTGEYAALLDQMALAGGQPRAGSPSYYPANNQAELQAALETIAVSVISCEIALEQPPDMPDQVHIYLDGTEVQRDAARQNGWDYTNAGNLAIQLYGAPCTTIQDGQKHDIIATFACPVY